MSLDRFYEIARFLFFLVFFFCQNEFIWNWLRQVNHGRIFPFSTRMDCNKRGFAAVVDHKNLLGHSSCLLYTLSAWRERAIVVSDIKKGRLKIPNFVTGIAAGFRKCSNCSPAYFLTDRFFNSWLLCYKTDLCSHRHFSDAWLTVQDRNSSFFQPISYCFSCVFCRRNFLLKVIKHNDCTDAFETSTQVRPAWGKLDGFGWNSVSN